MFHCGDHHWMLIVKFLFIVKWKVLKARNDDRDVNIEGEVEMVTNSGMIL